MPWLPFGQRRNTDPESALDAELRDHLDRQIADNRRAGMSDAEARRQAYLAIGGVAQVKERVRDEWRPRWVGDFWRDLRFGARLIRRSPLFAALVLVTLAFAVGANVTVFTIVNAIWLEPRPVSEPERVVVVTNTVGDGSVIDMVNPRRIQELRAQPVFSDVAGQVVGAGLLGDARPRIALAGESEELEPVAVTANYFDVLGVPVTGRGFSADDDVPGAPAVAILSDQLWRTAFDADPGVIGQTIQTRPEAVTVVGIAPRGFRGARLGEMADLWIPMSLAPRMSVMAPLLTAAPEGPMMNALAPGIAFARLAEGVAAGDAEAVLNVDTARRSRYRVFPLSSVIGLPAQVTTPLGGRSVFVAVSVMAMLVLVGGCATLAVLMLVHLERRRQELTVREALGCGRARLTRAVLGEVTVLAAAGVALALLVSTWLLGAVRSLSLPTGLSFDRLDLAIDWRVVAVGLCVGIATMAVAATLPLAFGGRRHLAASLTFGGTTSSAASLRFRYVMLTVQVAATLVLLVGAALFVRTVAHVFSGAAGFDVDRTVFLTVQPSLVEFYDPATNPDGERSDAMRRAAWLRLVEALQSAPGVRSVALGDAPVRTDGRAETVVTSTFKTSDGEQELPYVYYRVDAGYVDALGLTVLAGEMPAGGTGTLLTVSLADRLFPDRPAVGQYVEAGRGTHHVVGIVNDFVQGSTGGNAVGGLLSISTALDQQMAPGSVGRVSLVIAATGDAGSLVPVVERITREVFPKAATLQVASGRQLLEADLGRERLGAAFFTGFGLVSLLLGVAGVFGLVAYLAESRARELGVRLALGATPNTLLAAVIAPSLLPVVAGTIAGLIIAALASGTLASLVHGISTLDALSYAGAAGVMLASALGAGLVAALRVRRLSPMDALRAE